MPFRGSTPSLLGGSLPGVARGGVQVTAKARLLSLPQVPPGDQREPAACCSQGQPPITMHSTAPILPQVLPEDQREPAACCSHVQPPTTMHSLDEPLDLKLRAAREKRERTLGVARHRALHRELGLVDDSPTSGSPGSPPTGFLLNPKCPEKVEGRFSTAPLVDLSLSPPSGPDSPNGSSSLSPECQGNGDLPPVPTAPDFQPLRYLDGVPGSFQFFLPLGSGGALHLPASSFLTPPKDKCLSPELPLPKQLVCRWAKCNQLFELLQDLVDHVNDYHVKPEKDAGYCCHWEGCARHGRGFNARYKMLIHIRTHTNEKPHRCPTCNKSFSRLENLKIHNRSHTGWTPDGSSQSTRCLPVFPVWSRLPAGSDGKAHICLTPHCTPAHSGALVKPHRSGPRLGRSQILCPTLKLEHMLLGSSHGAGGGGGGPYEGCNKRYSNSSDRFKHTRTHYVDKPYYCKMPGCHKRYTDPSSLRKHIKAHGHFVSHEQQELLQLRPPAPLGAGGLGLPVVSLLAGSAGSKAEGEKGRGPVPARALGMEGRKTPLERTESSRSRPSPDGLPLLPGTVLDLSTGVNSAASSPEALAPGWVVIPPGSVLLKPAVVN
ncbi:zinc finger protein GLIS2 [Tupaia chinensis]|uniref:zinc finger protein GLIS2 n=1 Tax=Tupaia chinensis TaxID=246437 RepID=UPI000FFB2B4D|nr:zinc finger protein GLIS2 [Tupaia chinensis]